MLARRLLLLLSILLLTAALSSALTASSRDDGDDAPPLRLTPPTSPDDRVTANLPAERAVRARVGDVVVLRVRSADADRAEIRGLGVDVAVGSGLDGELLLVADRPGRFPVTLRYSGREIGTLAVADR
ncbi:MULTISPECIES: hypothetical protein [Solirubrobacterales]|uniref:Uncharacterized protein n=1 Tax=Paraconexibacter algicola TaxID=2133960 RepID=A0A2T4UE85_9ACTN|nr:MULTISPECIES: hypothetical protein [Solirubrobacterales]PTL56091.1 hypothetical protein C7Y72_13920 [Paraconexibacter algicola]